MNRTAELQLVSSSYSAQQYIGTIEPEIEVKEDLAISDGKFYLFRTFGPWVSEEWKHQTSFGIFWRTEISEESEKRTDVTDISIIKSAQKYYEEHRETLFKKYKGKYIAILNNKVIGSDKDFSKLAQRVYKKYGYQTIYMPFVDTKEKVVRIPSPRIKIL